MQKVKLSLLFIFNFSLLNICSAQNDLPIIKQVKFSSAIYSIDKYGAKGDGKTLNTKSITEAIDQCSKNGGGMVVIPNGIWLSGPIVLKSNVNLHLENNALLQFTKDFDQYPLVEGNWEGVPQMRNQSPISAYLQENIAITGKGIIDGNGDAWRMVKRDKLNETQWRKLINSGGVLSEDKKTWYPTEKSFAGSKLNNPGVIVPGKSVADYGSVKDFLRPNMVVLNSCKRILLEGITFQNSPAWNLHPLMCEDLTVKNVYAKNPWYAQNGDGIDVESCKNIVIENSTFDVGDDGICIKSGKDEAGRKRGKPTENLLVRNCTVYHAHGGFVIGSEMSGGARNIYVQNCTFIGTDIGLRFKTSRGRGGIVENIFINNINMKDIVGEAILFDMYYAAVDPIQLVGEKREIPKTELLPVNEGTPQFRNFFVKNVTCNGASKALFIRGLPEMHISNIHLDSMIIIASKGIEITEASGVFISNVHVSPTNTNPVIDIINSDKIVFSKLEYPTSSGLLFKISGDRSSGISIDRSETTAAKNKVSFDAGAKESSVIFK